MKKILVFLCLISVLTLTSCNMLYEKYYNEGMNRIETKDYAGAEKSLKTAIEKGYSKNKINIVYSIVSGYNDAKDAFEEENFEKAAEYLERIPNSYTQYLIKQDVDELKKDIEKHAKEKESVNKVKALFEQGKYTEAYSVALTVDTGLITEQAVAELEEIKSKILLKQKNENFDYVRKINNLFESYVYGLCEAVNTNNFRPLKGLLKEGSSIYKTQKSYIANVGSQDIYEYVVDFEVNNINWISDTQCIVSTIETYDIYNGEQFNTQTFKYTYDVVETSDKQLFLTTIKKS